MKAGQSYCPAHEYDWGLCCRCCVDRKAELRAIDTLMRVYFVRLGYRYGDRTQDQHDAVVRDRLQRRVASAAPEPRVGRNPNASAA